MPKVSSWTPADIKWLTQLRSVENRRWVDIGAIMGRSKTAVQAKWDYLENPKKREFAAERLVFEKAPLVILQDRDHRMTLAPRDLTAQFFGDPPVGYSALDKRASA